MSLGRTSELESSLAATHQGHDAYLCWLSQDRVMMRLLAFAQVPILPADDVGEPFACPSRDAFA